MTYHAPLADIALALKYGASLAPAIEQGLFGDLSMEDVDAIVAEAGRFAGEVLAPLNRIGDTFGTLFKDGAVTTAPGWKEAYRDWRLAGWNAVTAPAQWGGRGVAANRQRRLHRNVAWRVHRFCQRTDGRAMPHFGAGGVDDCGNAWPPHCAGAVTAFHPASRQSR